VDNCIIVKSMVKRNRVEIMADILGLCSKPQTKTQVMYGTNLSWRMLQHYLSQLQKLGLLEIHDETKKYVTTKRGKEFIQKWRELEKLLLNG
jgi:predicted transcriptional regulator